MPEGFIVADRIHALVAKPSATLADIVAGLDSLKQTYGADTVILALAVELMTATARLASRLDAGKRGLSR